MRPADVWRRDKLQQVERELLIAYRSGHNRNKAEVLWSRVDVI